MNQLIVLAIFNIGVFITSIFIFRMSNKKLKEGYDCYKKGITALKQSQDLLKDSQKVTAEAKALSIKMSKDNEKFCREIDEIMKIIE